jgi:hypothetical protein
MNMAVSQALSNVIMSQEADIKVAGVLYGCKNLGCIRKGKLI